MALNIRGEIWPAMAAPDASVRVQARVDYSTPKRAISEQIVAVLTDAQGRQLHTLELARNGNRGFLDFRAKDSGAEKEGLYYVALRGSNGSRGPSLPLFLTSAERRESWIEDALQDITIPDAVEITPEESRRGLEDAVAEFIIDLWKRGRIASLSDVGVRLPSIEIRTRRALIAARVALSMLADATVFDERFELTFSQEDESTVLVLRTQSDALLPQRDGSPPLPTAADFDELPRALREHAQPLFPAIRSEAIRDGYVHTVRLRKDYPYEKGQAVYA